jgi:hypothetical protein
MTFEARAALAGENTIYQAGMVNNWVEIPIFKRH